MKFVIVHLSTMKPALHAWSAKDLVSQEYFEQTYTLPESTVKGHGEFNECIIKLEELNRNSIETCVTSKNRKLANQHVHVDLITVITS